MRKKIKGRNELILKKVKEYFRMRKENNNLLEGAGKE